MYRQLGVAGILAFGAGVAFAASEPNKDSSIPEEARLILEKAEQLVVFSVDPEWPKAKPRDEIRGWKVLGKTTVTDAGARKTSAGGAA